MLHYLRAFKFIHLLCTQFKAKKEKKKEKVKLKDTEKESDAFSVLTYDKQYSEVII